MFRKTCLTLGASLALIGQPLAAQDQPDAETMAALTEMFAAEPLTAEQQARLPKAQTIVAKVIPEGSMQEMMDGMFDGLLGSLLTMEIEDSPEDTATFVAGKLGVSADEMTLSEGEIAEIADMFDPVRAQRKQREAELLPEMMGEMMTAMEPTMRRVMAEMYAISFTDAELNDIDAFFSTDSGAAFARKSFTMATDPRMMSASMEALPDMMGVFANMEARLTEATADLPPARSFAELTAAERAKVASATGYDEGTLQQLSASVADTE